MKNNIIKRFFKLRGLKQREYGRLRGSSETWVSTKIKNYSFSLKELIELGELTNTQLAFIDKETGEVVIQFDDEITLEMGLYSRKKHSSLIWDKENG